MKILRHDGLKLIVRLFLGGLFIYASFHKISDPQAFADIVKNYSILPRQLINIFALVLPWLEMFAGVALILGIWHDGAALWVFALTAMFLVAVGLSMIRGIDLSCGCFSTSPDSRKATWVLLLEDIGLLILGYYLLSMGSGRFALLRAKSA